MGSSQGYWRYKTQIFGKNLNTWDFCSRKDNGPDARSSKEGRVPEDRLGVRRHRCPTPACGSARWVGSDVSGGADLAERP